MENKKPTKKALIAEIMATPTPTGGEFNVASLERTNVGNLQLVLDILNAKQRLGFASNVKRFNFIKSLTRDANFDIIYTC